MAHAIIQPSVAEGNPSIFMMLILAVALAAITLRQGKPGRLLRQKTLAFKHSYRLAGSWCQHYGDTVILLFLRRNRFGQPSLSWP
ncbi:hypothetical protein AYI73_15195 [Shewanella algae]|nr:hypothetical protein AYI86_12470 [Shewanella algae]TVP05078.1 hypothetical protein AYI73_15195 [Shewanella algae]